MTPLDAFTAGRIYLVVTDYGDKGCEGLAYDFKRAYDTFFDRKGDDMDVRVLAVEVGRPTVDVTDIFEGWLRAENPEHDTDEADARAYKAQMDAELERGK